MSATSPAHVAPTLEVIENVFFEDLLTRKFPNAILFSLARTMPPSKVTPTAVAPGIYIDISRIIVPLIKGFLYFVDVTANLLYYKVKIYYYDRRRD